MLQGISQSRGRRLELAGLVGLLGLLAVDAVAATPGIPFGRIAVAGERVERSANGRDWSVIEDGSLLRTGDYVRSDERSLARLEVGWVKLVLSPSSEIEIPPSKVLSIRLRRGRLEQTSEGASIVTIRTSECVVRGKGHIVLRRVSDATVISARAGRFQIQAPGGVTNLDPGFGVVVPKGKPPHEPRALLPAPEGLVPGPDPLYVERNEPVRLEWRSSAQAYDVELIAVGAEASMQQTDVESSPATITVPWPGTYRWRVVARDDEGIESLPSRSGLLCVPGW